MICIVLPDAIVVVLSDITGDFGDFESHTRLFVVLVEANRGIRRWTSNAETSFETRQAVLAAWPFRDRKLPGLAEVACFADMLSIDCFVEPAVGVTPCPGIAMNILHIEQVARVDG